MVSRPSVDDDDITWTEIFRRSNYIVAFKYGAGVGVFGQCKTHANTSKLVLIFILILFFFSFFSYHILYAKLVSNTDSKYISYSRQRTNTTRFTRAAVERSLTTSADLFGNSIFETENFTGLWVKNKHNFSTADIPVYFDDIHAKSHILVRTSCSRNVGHRHRRNVSSSTEIENSNYFHSECARAVFE